MRFFNENVCIDVVLYHGDYRGSGVWTSSLLYYGYIIITDYLFILWRFSSLYDFRQNKI